MASKTSPKGAFITFEGIDGSGKSTQALMLITALKNHGVDVLHTREPGGSVGAEEIRKLLVEGEPDRWSPETEILLFTAARRDHLEKTITPTINAGITVISDRFADSTRVYQGAARADLRGVVDDLHSQMIGVEPDLTFIIDMDPEAALARGLARQSGEDRFEDFGQGFQERLRDGFIALAKDFPSRCHVIDGTRDIDVVHADILTIAQDYLS